MKSHEKRCRDEGEKRQTTNMKTTKEDRRQRDRRKRERDDEDEDDEGRSTIEIDERESRLTREERKRNQRLLLFCFCFCLCFFLRVDWEKCSAPKAKGQRGFPTNPNDVTFLNLID